ncbi:MAG: PDR/VanB family oxidoreductase [Paracoccaceae bacterium]
MDQKIQAKILATKSLTSQIKEFSLSADVDLPEFIAGAHIRVAVPNGNVKCYSLIEWPQDTTTSYRIAVLLDKDGQGGSEYMHGLLEGSGIEFEPPKNDFPLDEAHPATLLAGGIGITPMISMATRLRAINQEFEFHFTARSAENAAYCNDLTQAFGAQLHLHFDDDPTTALDLPQLIADLSTAHHLYICGPQGMIEAAKKLANDAGIAAERIHFELFNAPQSQEKDQPFEVELSSTGQVFTIPVGQTIVGVLDAAGVDIMFDCQRGDCGICQTDVISGVPDHRDVILSDDEKAANDVMQICVSRAKSPRLVLDI